MDYILRNNCWWGAIRSNLQAEKVLLCKLDTGAQATTINLSTVATIKHMKDSELRKYLYGKRTVTFTGIAGTPVECTPCHLSNVQLCDIVIRDFYCMIPVIDSKKVLIGGDLISACMVQGLRGGIMTLTGLDEQAYKRNFMATCKSVNPVELLDISMNEMLLLGTAQKSRQCLQYKDKFNLTDAEFDKEILRILYKNNISSIDMLEYIIQHESPIGRDPMRNKTNEGGF